KNIVFNQNGGAHFAPELGGHFELESGAHFKTEWGDQYNRNLHGMTKAAMIAISNGLSKLTIGTEVTVNTILGGPTYSDGVAAAIEQIASAQNIEIEQMKSAIIQQTNAHSLLQRFIEPSEIAALAVYIASPLSIATNGACVRADGGILNTM
ncbi:SDR family oxidoreductase, partial [Flavobacterium cupreum]